MALEMDVLTGLQGLSRTVPRYQNLPPLLHQGPHLSHNPKAWEPRQAAQGLRQVGCPGLRQAALGLRQVGKRLRQAGKGLRKVGKGLRQAAQGLRQAGKRLMQVGKGLRQAGKVFRTACVV